MAKQTINIGSAPDDGTGDTIRDSFDKVNDNFTEVYDSINAFSNSITTSNTITVGNSTVNTLINSTAVAISNSSVNVVIDTNTVKVGNSSVNVVITSNKLTAPNFYFANLSANLISMVSNGNIGIGNTTPAHTLVVNGNTRIYSANSARPLQVSSNNGHIVFASFLDSYFGIGFGDQDVTLNNYAIGSYAGGISGELLINRITGSDITFRENNVTQVTMKASGNTGFMNTAPVHTVSINGDAFIRTSVTIGNSTVNTTISPIQLITSNFNIANTSANNISILTSGNVGIGNTAPAQKLVIDGDVRISTNTLSRPLVIQANGGHISFGSMISGYVGMTFGNAALTINNYHISSAGTGGTLLLNRSSTFDISFRENNTERVVMKTGGNTGFMNTAPVHTVSIGGDVYVNTSILIGNSTVNAVVNSSALAFNSRSIASRATSKYRKSANQAFSANATHFQSITFDTSVISSANFTSNIVYTAQHAGVYNVGFTIQLLGDGTPVTPTVSVFVNNTQITGYSTLVAASQQETVSLLEPVSLAVNDTVEVKIYTTQSITILGNTFFSSFSVKELFA